MAASGFEGFEKRLELQFAGGSDGRGLRRLEFPSLEKVLHAVGCTVVSAVGCAHFDSYVLSESSMFVYPTKVIIKTCGTTQLLQSVGPLVCHAASLGLTLLGCRYTRGNFIFPKAQPYPHTSFNDEALYLQQNLPRNILSNNVHVKVMSSKWHVFTAGDVAMDDDDLFTVEICMTGLDRVQARKFFRRFGDGKTGDSAGMEMTGVTGIGAVNPNALICDYAFEPCGYSMNGIDGDRYSTVHVTPEEGFSYASYECVGSVYDDGEEIYEALRRVVRVFRPAAMSVATTCAAGQEVWRGVAKAVEPLGMRLRSRAAHEFPTAGSVVFQTFAARRKKGCVAA